MNQYGHQPVQNSSDGPSGLAWATLLLGIGAWVVLPGVASIGAVICGVIERKNIREGRSSAAGQTVVTIGLVAAAIQLALAALAMVIVVGIFALMMLGVAIF